MQSRSILTNVLKLIFGLTLLVLVLLWSDTQAIIAEFSRVNWPWLVLLAPAWLINMALSGWALFALFRKLANISYFSFLKAHVFTQSLGAFLPFQIGELSLAIVLRRYGIGPAHAILTILIDKLISLAVLAAVSVWGLSMLDIIPMKSLLLALILCGILVLLLSTIIIAPFNFPVRKYIPQRVFDKFYAICEGARKMKGALFANFILTVLRFLLFIPIPPGLMFLSFGAEVPFTALISISSVAWLVSIIPVSIQGIGTVEISAVYLYSRVGVDDETVLAVYLLARVISFVFHGVLVAIGFSLGKFELQTQTTRDFQ